MLNTVKDTFHTIGDRSSELAKAFGSETTHLAKRFRKETASLAKQIGVRRGLIGLAMLAATVGGTVMLVRYLRARKFDKGRETGDHTSHGARSHNRSQAQHSGHQPSH